jgi:hypothetical protein
MDRPSFQQITPPLWLYSGADSPKHLGYELKRPVSDASDLQEIPEQAW